MAWLLCIFCYDLAGRLVKFVVGRLLLVAMDRSLWVGHCSSIDLCASWVAVGSFAVSRWLRVG